MRWVPGVVAVLLAVGCAGEEPMARVPVPPEVEVVASDERAADAVPVGGAIPVERDAAHDALARLGESRPIARVTFVDRYASNDPVDPRRRVVSVVVRIPVGKLLRGFEAGWLAFLFGRDVATELERRNVEIALTETIGARAGSLFDPIVGPAPGADELRQLGGRIVARGANAGLDVQRVTGWRIVSGAVRVVVRLTARQALAGRENRWVSTLLDERERRRYALLLVMRGPDGEPLSYSANADRRRGGWWTGRSVPAVGDRSPALPDGPTRLRLVFHPFLPRDRPIRFRLDCERASSRGVPAPLRLCAALERGWLTLLPPTSADIVCRRLAAGALTVRGTLGGVRVSRRYASCHEETIDRWRALLGVGPG